MKKLFIADDEAAIREGIKYLVDWNELGYEICGEAANGDEALKGILEKQPALVLMDIRMPGLLGLEVIEKAKAAGFEGCFIILSGYSDFKYAQTAMKVGVRHYLTKPIDEDELTAAVNEISAGLKEAADAKKRSEYLKSKSQKELLVDLVSGKLDFGMFYAGNMGLASEIYQIVIYESFDPETEELPYQFSEMFRLAGSSAGRNMSVFDHFEYRHKNILLLRSNSSVERFRRFIEHYDTAPQKGSPLDTLFIAYAAPVKDLKELPEAYRQASALLERRFFCVQGQHVVGPEDLPTLSADLVPLDNSLIQKYCDEISDFLQTFNRRKVAEELYALQEYLYRVDADITAVKLFVTDLYLRIKETMSHRYSAVDIPFDTNSDIIDIISKCNYLYESIIYFSKQFEIIMNAIGNSSRDSVMDDILYYIDHNYHTNIKLEMIASLFGYNSSYLGKIFSKTVGDNFNTYVDRVRINHAIELLGSGELKVYEIAEKVGYKNVDYFHKKFKKYVGESPAEYRQKNL